MHQIPSRWIPTLLAAATLAALTACGGNSSPPATAVATADTATVPWNKATTLSVTTNDTIANGTATVAVTTPPANGTTEVTGGSITYTPKPGFFGNDTLSYTLTVGNKTSTADVHIAVAAHMTLSGTVRDAAMPGAKVVMTVGGVALPAVTADADGNYTVDVTTTSPSDFITLQATGAGAQSNVVLTSLVGDAVSTAAVAATDGTVSAATLPAANVTNVTTAQAVLVTQALGKAPTSSADIAATQGKFTSDQTIQMATAIKLVADAGVALPGGASDTLALVSDPATYTSFVNTQATTNATVFASTKAAVVSDPALAVPPAAPVAGAPDIKMVLTVGQGAGADPTTSLTLRADHTASIGGVQPATGTWASDGKQITVTYDKPLVGTTQAIASDGYQWPANESDTAIVVRQIGTGMATLNTIGSTTFTDGPDNGTTQQLADNWTTMTLVSTTTPFKDGDLAVGAEWAGVITTDAFDPSLAVPSQDVLKVVDGTHVLFERTGVTGTYTVAGSTLTVTVSNATFTYTHLFTGPRGEERWLTSRLDAKGSPVWQFDAAMVKVTPNLSFSTDTMANDYLSYINVGLVGGQFYIHLMPNGTGVGNDQPTAPTTPGIRLGTWVVNSDGTETLSRYYCAADSNGVSLPCSADQIAADKATGSAYAQIRTWKLLAVSGNNLFVMERLSMLDGIYDQYRVNVYTKTN